jgi:PAS domain S-box-containing protein
MSDPDPRLVRRCHALTSASAVFAVLVGVLGVAGWKLHIATLGTWGVTTARMAANAAACFILLGVTLWLLRKDDQSFAPARRFTARTLAAFVCLVALLSLAEFILDRGFGIDEVLAGVPPAEQIDGLRMQLMASIAAVDFVVLGLALLLLDWKTRGGDWPAQFLCFGAVIGAVFGFFTLLLQPQVTGITMALPTAAAFLVVACGVVCSRPTWAVGGLLVSQNAGARLLRSVIPAALLVLGLIGWSVSKALLTEAHFNWAEVSLLAILCGILLAGFVTWIAFIVDRSDALNAELERRVERRTAALQSEIAVREQAEEAAKESLAASEAALKDLAEQKFALDQHAIVAVTDLQGTITYVNDRFSAINHYSREEAIGRNYRIVNSGYHPKEFFQRMYDTIGQGRVWHGEIRNRAKDGSIFWVDATIVPLLDSEGKPRQYITIRTDITERKRLEEIREWLAAVVESSDDAIISKTLNGMVTAWNSGAERLFGYSSAEALGKPMDRLLPLDRANEESDILARIARGDRLTRFETVRVRKDGKRVDISETISPVEDCNGAIVGVATIARDITQRKAYELEILKLNDELEERVTLRTAQLEAVNKELETFSYSVSHDLRAPLRHISGFSELLVEEFGATLAPAAQKYVERIQAGTQQMGVLVDELLNLARLGRHALRLQPTTLNPIVAEMLAILQPQSEGRQVEWVIADLPAVQCDPVLVKQIFQNLLSNALKFTRPRARAVIEVNYKKQADGQVAFMIRDNGVGFDMKYAGKLFGVFQRLHRAEDFEGTGIGLATVQRISQKHGGRVWAEGKLDKGATFYFTLGAGKQARSKSNGATAGGRL